jgi:anti-sigma regulatory factor (Ser/Thr protein kinase)
VLPAGTWPVRWTRHDGLELDALEAAVPGARVRTRQISREWGLAPLADDAEAIIAELAANAITATRGAVKREGGRGFVRTWMLGDASRLLILVWDRTPLPPVVREPGAADEEGRGLLLVEALAARWRWYHPARPYGGKVVWALLRAAPWPEAGGSEAVAPGGVAGAGGPRRMEGAGR